MVVQLSGELLLRLMRLERGPVVDTEWLLHGPTDPAVVRPPKPSEPCASSPNTGRPSRR
jgi:hypothetical protein